MVAKKGELKGMAEICRYVRRTEVTVLSWIHSMDFPAKKIDNEFFAHKTDVDQWLEEIKTVIEPKPQETKKFPRVRIPRW